MKNDTTFVRSVKFNFFINCNRQKRFSQNERSTADLQNVASDFLIVAMNMMSKFAMQGFIKIVQAIKKLN